MLGGLGLSLSPEKTRIVELTRGKEGFDFLGFHMRKVESWRWRGKWYLQRWPSARAMNSIRSKIRQLTDRRYTGLPIADAVDPHQPRAAGLGQPLPPRQLRADRQLRPRTPRDPRLQQARTLRPQMNQPLRRFSEHCRLPGIRVTKSNHRNLTVSHRTSVAIMEQLVGPKT